MASVMTDATERTTAVSINRANILKGLGQRDKIFQFVTWLSAVTVLILLGAVFISLFHDHNICTKCLH